MNLEDLEKKVMELQAEKIARKAVEQYRKESRRRTWEFVKVVVVPIALALITVWVAK